MVRRLPNSCHVNTPAPAAASTTTILAAIPSTWALAFIGVLYMTSNKKGRVFCGLSRSFMWLFPLGSVGFPSCRLVYDLPCVPDVPAVEDRLPWPSRPFLQSHSFDFSDLFPFHGLPFVRLCRSHGIIRLTGPEGLNFSGSSVAGAAGRSADRHSKGTCDPMKEPARNRIRHGARSPLGAAGRSVFAAEENCDIIGSSPQSYG